MPAGSDGRSARPVAVVFDLEEALLDRRKAWLYTIEQSISIVTGERVDAQPLVEEYWRRPYAHAIDVLVAERSRRSACEARCAEIYRRSAMKSLRVQEGIGTALIRLVAAQVQVGAASREPHLVARKQIEATGLDRFVTVLASTPEGDSWNVASCLAVCMAFLDCDPKDCMYVTPSRDDAEAARRTGWRSLIAGWALPPSDELWSQDARHAGAAILHLWGGLRR